MNAVNLLRINAGFKTSAPILKNHEATNVLASRHDQKTNEMKRIPLFGANKLVENGKLKI